MDSGTYNEAATLTINKSVSIIAAPGQAPTLGCSGAAAYSVVTVAAGSAGGRIGSNDGGRITIDRGWAPTNTLSGGYGIQVTGLGLGEMFTIENVNIKNFSTGGINCTGARGILNVSNVDLDGGFIEAHRTIVPVPAYKVGFRLTGTTATGTGNNGGTFNLTRVMIRNVDFHAILLNNSSTSYLKDITLNIDTCDISTWQHGAVTLGNNANLTVNVTNSVLRAGGGAHNVNSVMVHSAWSAFRYNYNLAASSMAPSGTLNVTRTVMGLWPNFGTSSVVSFPGTNSSSDMNITIDHCDLIVPLGATNITTDSIRSRTAVSLSASQNRNFTFTNNNIFGPDYNDAITTPARISGILMASGSTGTNNIDYNNLWVSDWPTSGVTVGNHEVTPARDPLYTDRANLDFRYTDPIILTASDTGGPLGVNSIMANIVPVELSSFGLN